MKQLLLILVGAALSAGEAAAQQAIPPLKKEFIDSAWHVLPSAAGARYRRETEYRDSTAGEVRDYYLSGQLQSRTPYENLHLGIQDGTAETYYPTGQLKSHAEVTHGKPSGDYIGYYPNGQIQNQVRYLNGALDDSKCFDSDGKQMECPAMLVTLPIYLGGDGSVQAVSTDFGSKFRYRRSARRANTVGRIVISFEVDKQGNIANAYIEKGLEPEVDAEALRAIGRLKSFRPGTQGGRPVSVHYRLPLTLQLE